MRADGRGKVMPAHGQRAGGERDRDDVVAGGPREVLDHLAVARAREPDHADHTPAGPTTRARRRRTRSRRRCRRRSRCRRRRGRGRARRSRRRRPSRPRARAPGARRPRVLVFGEHLGEHLVDARRSARDALGDLAGVAGDHHDRLHARARAAARPRRALRADLVLERERTDHLVVAVRRRAPSAAPRSTRRRLSSAAGTSSRAPAAAPGRRPRTRAPSTRASTPRPVSDRKSRRGARPPSPAAVTIARASGCSLSASTAAASAAARLADRPSPATASVTTWRPSVSVPVLSNSTASTRAHPLEREPVLDQDAGAGGDRGRDRDHERDRQAERVRAGDDEHGDGALDRRVDVAEQRPDDERDDRRRRRRRRTAARRTRSASACARLVTRLRFGDEPLDAGQRGVVADRVDPHPQRESVAHRAGDDAVARPLRDRPRLAGDHRLVELGLAVDDRAVGGHPAARAHEHDVADAQLVERHRLDRRRSGRRARRRRAAARRARRARPAPGRSPSSPASGRAA